MGAAGGRLPARGRRLLAITILTSHDEAGLQEVGVLLSLADSVRRLARLAKEAGIDGGVASPPDVGHIRDSSGQRVLDRNPRVHAARSQSSGPAQIVPATPR